MLEEKENELKKAESWFKCTYIFYMRMIREKKNKMLEVNLKTLEDYTM